MKKRVAIFIALAILVISFCERDKSGPQGPSGPRNAELSYLSFQDHGCAAGSAKASSFFDPPRLIRHGLEGDTLTLTFYYWANCCPVYEDSAAVQNDVLEIYFTELNMGCWCSCPFENDFIFRWNQGEQLHIRFIAETSCYPDGPATVDTTIVIQ